MEEGSTLPPHRKARLDNIDFLRAVGVLAVMAYHFTTRCASDYCRFEEAPFTFQSGKYGVDLFFIVSGFCIFMTLDSARSLEHFWARRLARIQPAYISAVLVTFFIVALAGLPGREVSLPVALSNLIWLNAIPGWPMVDNAYWTLIVELKFYFWIGVIYYLMHGRNISAAWAAVTFMAVLVSFHPGAPGDVASQVFLGPFAPAFLMGLLAWEWPRLRAWIAWPLFLLCLALLAISPRFEEGWLIGGAIGLFGFAVLRLPKLRFPRAITLIGLISYSLYLLHQNIGYVLLREIPLPMPLRLVVVTAVLIAMATLLYRLVERRWERQLIQLIERNFAVCRDALRLPRRRIPCPSVQEEMRAW